MKSALLLLAILSGFCLKAQLALDIPQLNPCGGIEAEHCRESVNSIYDYGWMWNPKGRYVKVYKQDISGMAELLDTWDKIDLPTTGSEIHLPDASNSLRENLEAAHFDLYAGIGWMHEHKLAPNGDVYMISMNKDAFVISVDLASPDFMAVDH